MADAFATYSDAVFAPARRLVPVTPHDSNLLADIPKALWVAAAGTVTVVGVDDTSTDGASLGDLAVGTIVPVRARMVKATGTTATVVALY